MSTITMDVTEYDELRAALQRAHQETADLHKQLGQTLDKHRFWFAAKAATEVIKFTMAHYSAEAFHGWPGKALTEFATFLLMTPGVSLDLQSWASDACAFATEAATWDTRRDRSVASIRAKLDAEKTDKILAE